MIVLWLCNSVVVDGDSRESILGWVDQRAVGTCAPPDAPYCLVVSDPSLRSFTRTR